MILASFVFRSATALVTAGLLAACGGKTAGIAGSNDGAGSTPDAGVMTGAGLVDAAGLADAPAQVGRDASVCVDVDPATLDRTCVSDGDCSLVQTGHICNGDCTWCNSNAAVNAAGVHAYQADIASITEGECGKCADLGVASCIANRCTFCPGPGGCSDSGTVVVTEDAGPPPDDAGACVQVSPSSFSGACMANSDCILVTTGVLCSGGCACGDTPINNASLAAYEALTSSIMLEGCPCPDPGQSTCIQGTCTLCSFGPNQPPGCGDGG